MPGMTDHEALQLLRRHQRHLLGDTIRFDDAPPAVVRQVLATFEPEWVDLRPNGQPPYGWRGPCPLRSVRPAEDKGIVPVAVVQDDVRNLDG